MHFKYQFFVWIAICFASLYHVYAVPTDTRLRSQIGVTYKPSKVFEISASYRLDLEDNISRFQRSNYELGVGYSVLKWLDADISYRFITGFNKDVHRFKAGFSVKKSTVNKKFQFQWKSLVNFNSNYLDRDYWRFEDPTWVWRNKIRVKYNFSKKWSASLFTEVFFRLKDNNSYFYRTRFGTALDYKFKKRHSLSIGYYYQLEYYRKNPKNNNTFEIEYNLELKKRKKPKSISTPAAAKLF